MEVSKKEEFEEVIVNLKYLQQRIKIGKEMPKQLQDKVVQFLINHHENFAWCTEDMSGVNVSIAKHKLNINTMCQPMKQKLR